MNGKALLIGLSVALLLAIGLLIFGIGRILYGIAQDHLREPKLERKFQHPDFGMLTSDGDLWTTEVQRSGRDIRILVGGTDSAPSERLLSSVQSILGDFAAIESRAIEFLRSREPEVRQADVEFYMLDSTDEEHPNDFTFEFLDNRDDRVWRVEFISGEPKETGYDD